MLTVVSTIERGCPHRGLVATNANRRELNQEGSSLWCTPECKVNTGRPSGRVN
jgi:hypothetical protein